LSLFGEKIFLILMGGIVGAAVGYGAIGFRGLSDLVAQFGWGILARAEGSYLLTMAMSAPLAEVATRMMSSSHSHFFAVEDDKRIHGHICLENLRPILKDYEALCDVIIASDLMNHDVIVVKADESLDMVMQVFGRFELGEIPVVGNGQLVGTVRRSDVIEAYNRETIKLDVASGLATSLRLQQKMQSKRLAVAGGFIILEVRTPRIFVDKSLDVLDLRERFGATVLTIKREMEEGEGKVSYLLPTASTIVKEGDVLIIFGLQKDLSRFPHD
jgi:K+/H+ antiporter YhaU regulatory subunit KhtT/CBS domain-containing protein